MLDLASFFKHKWVCYLDVDERLDLRFINICDIIRETDADSFIFNLVHLWNDDKMFNIEYPSTMNGVSLKYRMFKNIGHAQIFSNRGKLHFSPIPYRGKTSHVPILIKHYGNLTKEMREEKYKFYQKEDLEHSQSSYEHLLKQDPKIKSTNEITQNDLIEAINLILPKI